MVAITIQEEKPKILLENNNVPPRQYYFKILESSVNSITYILLGSILVTMLWFVFNGDPFSSVKQHIILCVLGYQLLMAVAIMSLSPGNGWSSSMSLRHRKRVHWVLQILGSGMVIAGSAIEISNKTTHFTTPHGKLGILALAFTCVSLINGLTSLYASELRRFVPANFSKIGHILIGTAAFACAGACLCYGWRKGSFRRWASDSVAQWMIAVTVTYTIIIILTPCWTFYRRLQSVVKK